jgi:hypothetical protein
MGKLVPFRHPGNYCLIDVAGQLYRFPKDRKIPFEAMLMRDDIMHMPGLWAHPMYNGRMENVRTKKRGHNNP